MVTNPYFAIGDLQGCLESLDGLLEQLPEDAPLIFLGDLVNRGPESLAQSPRPRPRRAVRQARRG